MAAKAAEKLPLGKGRIGFKVFNHYPVPASKLWEAVTQGRHTERFFVEKVKGDFTPELTPVQWEWKKWGRHAQLPTVVQKNKKLEFRWADHKGKYLTTVTFTLRRKGKRIELEIHERGWKPADLENAFENCSGWTMFLDYLKAYVTSGIDLRTVTPGTRPVNRRR
jgi:uncharacterized protein YndB with AHSA1/START domain